MDDLHAYLKKQLEASSDTLAFFENLRSFIYEHSPLKHNPVDRIRWVPITKVQANDYNPNQVPKNEMNLLYTSIKHDGYTQPVVTVYDETIDKYVIVDGFHRYSVSRLNEDIRKGNHGYLPIVVIEKDINDRMASTIRHNRARGKHSVQGMSQIVFNMLQNGWSDAEIVEELGMEHEELIRLKHITGYSKLYKDVEYNHAWETDKQIRIRKQWEKENQHGEI